MGSLHTFFLSENIYHIVDPEYSQNTKNRFAQAGGAVFFVDRRDSRFMPRRGKSPAGHHVVTDCTGSRRLFYLKSHLESVPSLLLYKMQTFHWFAFWLFLQRPKPVGHPAFLFILRKAGCPFLMFNIFLSGAAMRHAFLTVFQFDSSMPVMRRFVDTIRYAQAPIRQERPNQKRSAHPQMGAALFYYLFLQSNGVSCSSVSGPERSGRTPGISPVRNWRRKVLSDGWWTVSRAASCSTNARFSEKGAVIRTGS